MTLTAALAQRPEGEVFAPSEPVTVVYQGVAYVIGDVPAGIMLETLARATAQPAGDARTELRFLAAAVTRDGVRFDQSWFEELPWRVFSRWLVIAQQVNGLDEGARESEKKA